MGYSDRSDHWLMKPDDTQKLLQGMQVKNDLEILVRKCIYKKAPAFWFSSALSHLSARRIEQGLSDLHNGCCHLSEDATYKEEYELALITLKKVRVFIKSLIP